MTSSAAGPARPTVPWNELRMPAVESVAQLSLVVIALVATGRHDPSGWTGRTTGVLVFAAATGAALLLATGGFVSDNRRAVRMAGAVAVFAGIVLLPAAVGIPPASGMWALASDVALLGVVGFLVLAVRASADRRADRIAAAVVGVVVAVATAALSAVAGLAPDVVPPAALLQAADLVVWSGAGAAALVVFIAGAVADRALLRGTALAFATLAAANAVRIAADAVVAAPAVAALQLAAVAMLLGVAVRFVRVEVRRVVDRRGRLVAAEAAVAAAAERERELQQLAGGLAGAADVLSREGAAPGPEDRRLLAAAGAEFERMREMLGGEPGPSRGEIGTVLRDLAVVHRANGLDVHAEVDGDPHAQVDVGLLARVLTNLLVNCAEHAPGARVWLRASPAEGRLRIEVVDDGADPAPESVAALVQRGGRGPRPAGSALGLAISAGLAERHHGRVTVTTVDPVDGTGAGGCIAVLELPVADERTDR
ncbi:sensor histidine kinase [Pseudonocardia humida]|uniref:HAMP domain-containing histidine kinase n=1 Tax=Pseudonocardia humida TaxID=2800819 RepID=A0ABT1ADK5_9PSEU|nr:HAMP domain-containing sensor histidine kinase [Pseudonocardia humida]MCO1661149.1 HAMP domain-containing histidine kinase [Pseudonocardia humida]